MKIPNKKIISTHNSPVLHIHKQVRKEDKTITYFPYTHALNPHRQEQINMI